MKFINSMLVIALAALTMQLSADNLETLRSFNHGKQAVKKQNDRQSKHDDCDERDHEKDCQPCHQNNNHRNEPNCPSKHDTLRLGIFEDLDPDAFTHLDIDTRTASGFDIQIWCQLARCLNRKFEFIAFPGDIDTARAAALQALLIGDIDAVATSVSFSYWLTNAAQSTNFLISSEFVEAAQTEAVIWNENYLPHAQFDTKQVTHDNILTNLWKIDELVFATDSSNSKYYKNLKLAAHAAGRSDEYFKSHVITNANYSKDKIQYITHFGPIGSDDKYQVLYTEKPAQFVDNLKRLQVCPWASATQEVDLKRSTIKSFIIPLQEDLNARGYLIRRDCCQFARDIQECINGLVCEGTYFTICESIAEQFPTSANNFCNCIPALYASFFHATVSRQCICCTFPNKPCERRNVCEIPCNPPFTFFGSTLGR